MEEEATVATASLVLTSSQEACDGRDSSAGFRVERCDGAIDDLVASVSVKEAAGVGKGTAFTSPAAGSVVTGGFVGGVVKGG